MELPPEEKLRTLKLTVTEPVWWFPVSSAGHHGAQEPTW